MTYSYTGTNIKLTVHANADCSDAGNSATVVSGQCDSDGDYFLIYEGTAIQMDK